MITLMMVTMLWLWFGIVYFVMLLPQFGLSDRARTLIFGYLLPLARVVVVQICDKAALVRAKSTKLSKEDTETLRTNFAAVIEV